MEKKCNKELSKSLEPSSFFSSKCSSLAAGTAGSLLLPQLLSSSPSYTTTSNALISQQPSSSTSMSKSPATVSASSPQVLHSPLTPSEPAPPPIPPPLPLSAPQCTQKTVSDFAVPLPPELIDEFKQKFLSKTSNNLITNKQTKNVFSKKCTTLNLARSLAISTLIRRHDLEGIINAIDRCDAEMDSDLLSRLDVLIPTADETELLKNVSQCVVLEKPEKILVKVMSIPFYELKIRLLTLKGKLVQDKTFLKGSLEKFKKTCMRLKETDITKLLNISNTLLAHYNQANTGWLQSLSKLNRIKSVDKSSTMLEYIINVWHKTHLDTDTQNPFPKPNDMNAAASVNFTKCQEELNLLKKEIDGK